MFSIEIAGSQEGHLCSLEIISSFLNIETYFLDYMILVIQRIISVISADNVWREKQLHSGVRKSKREGK